MGGLGDFFFGKPPPTNIKPQLQELGVDSNALGDDVGEVHGRYLSKGKLIWLKNNQLTERYKTKKYGGGLFSSTKKVKTYSYYGTAAYLLGEAAPGAKIGRMWFNSELVTNEADDYTADSDENQSGFERIYLWIVNWFGSRKNQFVTQEWRYYDGTQTAPHDVLVEEFGADAPAYTGSQLLIIQDLPLEKYSNGLPEVRAEIITSPTLEIETAESVTVTDPYGTGNFKCVPTTLKAHKSTIFLPAWDNGYANTNFRLIERYMNNTMFVGNESTFTPVDATPTPPNGLNDSFTVYREEDEIDHDGVDSIRYPNGMYQQRRNVFVYAGTNSGASEKRIYRRGPTGTTTYMVGGAYAVCLRSDGHRIYRLTATQIIAYDNFFNVEASINHGLTPAGTEAFGANFLWHDGDRVYYFQGTDASSVRVFDEDLTEQVLSGTLTSPSISAHSVGVAVDNGIAVRAYENGGETTVTIDTFILGRLTGTTYDLEEKVEELCAKVGVTIDASELSSMTFRGFKTGSGTARDYLEELQATYLFDIVPDGYGIKAIKREGKTSGGTLAWDDLGATTRDRPEVRVASEWEEADRLPHELALSYVDPEVEYDENVQFGYYPTRSRSTDDVETSLALLPDEAAQLADKLIKRRHVERKLFEFSLPQSYLGLKPSDVRTLETLDRNFVVRIDEVTETREQILQCRARLTDSTVYESTAVGMSGRIPLEIIPTQSEAETHLIDAPMLYDDQDEPGYLVSMWGQGYWAGGSLYRSPDGGTNWDKLQGFVDGVVMGFAFNTLPVSDGYRVDHTNTLSVRAANGTFPTGHDVFADEGICFYGADGRWEVIQYTTATVESDNTVTLAGIVRGRKGTEWATGLHEASDAVIVFDGDEIHFIGDVLESIGVEQAFLGVTTGLEDTLEDDDDIAFTYQGENLKPLSPVLGSAEYISGDSSMDIDFVPRTRFDNSDWWSDGSDPATESSASYEIDVLDAPDGTVLRTLSGTSLPIRYSGDDQTDDFGTPPSSVDLVAYQISPRSEIGRGRGYAFSSSPSAWQKPTWAEIDTGDMSYSADFMSATVDAVVAFTRTTIGQSTNKFVWQVTVSGSTNNRYIGLVGRSRRNTTNSNMDQSYMWGNEGNGDTNEAGADGTGITFGSGDVITCMVDVDAKTFTLTRNNNEASYTMGISANDLPLYPACSASLTGSTFVLETDLSAMTYAATLHPGVKELGYYE